MTVHSSTTPRGSRKRHDASRDEAVCWMCREGDETAPAELGPMCAPCACKGSIKYVHQVCLDAWRRKSKCNDECVMCGKTYVYPSRLKDWERDPPLSYYNDDFGGQLPADFRPMRFVPIAHPNSSLAVASARMVEFYIACNLTVAFFDHQGFGTDRSTAFVLLGYVALTLCDCVLLFSDLPFDVFLAMSLEKLRSIKTAFSFYLLLTDWSSLMHWVLLFVNIMRIQCEFI